MDSVAERFGVSLRPTTEKKIAGFMAETNVHIDDNRVPVTLFKHSA